LPALTGRKILAPRSHYRPCLSEDTGTGGRATGLVTYVVLEDFLTCKGFNGYLCGPPAMVQAGVRALKRRRMAPKRIHREEFFDASNDPGGS
jgi:phenol hydroxylase P5 protein